MHLDCFTKSQLVSQSIWSVRVIFAISLNKKCMSFKTKQQNRTDTILRDSNSLLTKVYLALDSYTSSRCSAYARRYFLLFDVHRWMLGLQYLPYVFLSLCRRKKQQIFIRALYNMNTNFDQSSSPAGKEHKVCVMCMLSNGTWKNAKPNAKA